MSSSRSSQISWLLAAVLGLSLLQQAAVACVRTAGSSDLKRQTKTGLISCGTKDTLLPARPAGKTDGGAAGRSRDLLLPLQPNIESSGEGSGTQESVVGHVGRTPSTGVLEINTFLPDGGEKRDLEGSVTDPPPPSAPQKLTQRIIHDDDQEIMIMKRNYVGVPVQSTTPAPTAQTINRNTTAVGAAPGKDAIKATAISTQAIDRGGTDTAKSENATEDKASTVKAGLKVSVSKPSPKVQSSTNQSPDTTRGQSEPPNSDNKQEATKLSPGDTETTRRGEYQIFINDLLCVNVFFLKTI